MSDYPTCESCEHWQPYRRNADRPPKKGRGKCNSGRARLYRGTGQASPSKDYGCIHHSDLNQGEDDE